MKSIKSPHVSIIILNWNGKKLTEPCLSSLEKIDYDNYEVIVLDNASTDDSVAYLKKRFPRVRFIEEPINYGFAKGNNIAIKTVIDEGKSKYLVTLNNDTKVDKNWLKELVKIAEEDPKVGGVSPKTYFYEQFLNIKTKSKVFIPKEVDPNSTDTRELSFRIKDISILNSDYPKILYQKGVSGEEVVSEEEKFRWVSGNSSMFLPVKNPDEDLNLDITLTSPYNFPIKIFVGDKLITTLNTKNDYKTFKIKIPKDIVRKNSAYIINNAGILVDENGFGKDIGINQFDRKEFQSIKELDAICGVSFFMRINALKKVGFYDPVFRAYYEDVDLSLRIRKAGYKLIYTPKAFIYHWHCASTGENSPKFIYYITRNHLIILLKHFPLKVFNSNLQEESKKFKGINNIPGIRYILAYLPIILLKRFSLIKT